MQNIDRAGNDRIEQMLDKLDIIDCITRVARGEDRRDAELITSCFWPDARIDLGIFNGSLSDHLEWVVPGDPALTVTLHTLGQSLVEIHGDQARVETHVTSYHRVNTGAEERDNTIGGRYLDQVEKRDGEWRIAARTMLYDWSQDFGVSVDWSQGLMGMPFSADHYTGRAHGDYSEHFFARSVDE